MPDITLSAPLKSLERLIVGAFAEVESWMRNAFAEDTAPFYSSVDLRNNGGKIAPIDTNLFPGGFNNLPMHCHPLAANLLSQRMETLCPTMKSVLLIPESHTRNLAYLDNVATLKLLLESAGIQVCLGRLDGAQLNLKSASGAVLEMFPIERDKRRLRCGDFYPCAVLLNNDLSTGVPPLLRDLEIPTMPSVQMGWVTRRKSSHFHHYRRAAEQLAMLLGADPYLLCADFAVCPKVDFHQREGMECLATAVDETLQQILQKYREHGIDDKPFVVLKANAGTYGMGVMTVDSAAAVLSLNRRQRNKMAVGKEGAPITEVLIQEGVQTAEKVGGSAAEPVVYMIDGTVAGGFYRVNENRANNENLNSRGMSFAPFPAACSPSIAVPPGNDTAGRLYVYGVIARLAALAAAREAAAAESPDK